MVKLDFITTNHDVHDVLRKARKESEEFLREIAIMFGDGFNLELSQADDAYVTIAYDGGRHPEYNSNCFSQVTSVYVENDKLMLSVEETEEYDINRVDDIDVLAVAIAVRNALCELVTDLVSNVCSQYDIFSSDDSDFVEVAFPHKDYIKLANAVKRNKLLMTYFDDEDREHWEMQWQVFDPKAVFAYICSLTSENEKTHVFDI